jgi:hypothetical protein
VELGYRVIEEYMREGQAFARRARPEGNAGAAFASDPRRMTDRLFQNAADFAAAWLEFAQTTMAQAPWVPPGGAGVAPEAATAGAPIGGFDLSDEPVRPAHPPRPVGGAPSTREEPREHRGGPQAPGAPTVTLDVVSKRRAEVTVDLRPGAARGRLVAHDLRQAAADGPRIGGVVIESDAASERVTVRLVVPDDRPPGAYAGLVVDEATNLPRGSISVRILEASQAEA